MEPTLTPTPTETATPTPTATPVALVYTIVAPGSETGQQVTFRWEMDAGDALVATLLLSIFLVLLIGILLDYGREAR